MQLQHNSVPIVHSGQHRMWKRSTACIENNSYFMKSERNLQSCIKDNAQMWKWPIAYKLIAPLLHIHKTIPIVYTVKVAYPTRQTWHMQDGPIIQPKPNTGANLWAIYHLLSKSTLVKTSARFSIYSSWHLSKSLFHQNTTASWEVPNSFRLCTHGTWEYARNISLHLKMVQCNHWAELSCQLFLMHKRNGNYPSLVTDRHSTKHVHSNTTSYTCQNTCMFYMSYPEAQQPKCVTHLPGHRCMQT